MVKRTSLAIVYLIIITAFIGITAAKAAPPPQLKKYVPIAPFWYDDPDMPDVGAMLCVVTPDGMGNCILPQAIAAAPTYEAPTGPSI